MLAMLVLLFGLLTHEVNSVGNDLTVTCNHNLDVSIASTKWLRLAVKGHELDSGCVSKSDRMLNFNLLSDGCHKGVKVMTGEVMIEIVGSDSETFKDVDSMVASCNLPPASNNQEGVEFYFAHGSDKSNSPNLTSVAFGDSLKIIIDATNSQFSFDSFGIKGCTMHNSLPSAHNAMEFPLIDVDGCKETQEYNPFGNKADATGFLFQGKMAFSDIFDAFRFPSSHFLLAQCNLIFCDSSSIQLCHQPDCESSSPKRSSLDPVTTKQTLSHEEETYRLNVTVAVGVDSVEQSLIEGHISLTNHLETTQMPDSEKPCGTKCVVLIVVAVFLAFANAVAITLIVKKMMNNKKELKVIDNENNPEKDNNEEAWSSDRIQGLEKLAPINLSASLGSSASSESSASSTISSSTASSRLSTKTSNSELEDQPRLRCLSPIETPTVTFYNTYI